MKNVILRIAIISYKEEKNKVRVFLKIRDDSILMRNHNICLKIN